MDDLNENLRKDLLDFYNSAAIENKDVPISDVLSYAVNNRSGLDWSKQDLINALVVSAENGEGLTNQGLIGLLHIWGNFEEIGFKFKKDESWFDVLSITVARKRATFQRQFKADGKPNPATLANAATGDFYGLTNDQIERHLKRVVDASQVRQRLIKNGAKPRARRN